MLFHPPAALSPKIVTSKQQKDASKVGVTAEPYQSIINPLNNGAIARQIEETDPETPNTSPYASFPAA